MDEQSLCGLKHRSIFVHSYSLNLVCFAIARMFHYGTSILLQTLTFLLKLICFLTICIESNVFHVTGRSIIFSNSTDILLVLILLKELQITVFNVFFVL